ncbi:ATP-binding protein [Vibrio algivorus]|uniref:ATP-binding protein n=1 Tax=Vibrio algivorus TaxID=1667024 RepID=UPI000B5CF434|nr:sensor histidine kinase [Vibrio algivorus]
MQWNTLNFRRRLLVIMTVSGLFELLVLTAAGFSYIKHTQQSDLAQKAKEVSVFLSRSPEVIQLIQTRQVGEQQKKMRDLTRLIGAAYIVVGDKNSIRLIHPYDDRLGKRMVGGDNQKALQQGLSYISYAKGSLGHAVRGKSAVLDSNGNIIGIVSVGYLLDNLQNRIEPYLAFLLITALLVLTLNITLANYASRRFQKAILGFEPEEIARLYVELDVTLSTIKEGVLSIDAHGILRSINRSACDILKLNRDEVINKPFSTVMPDSDLERLLVQPKPDHNINLYLNGQQIIANRSPIYIDGQVVGAVSSFRRRDEITDLTEKLSQTREYADLLRSQTHEHRNKLNTISGLLQLNEIEKVQSLIGRETEHYQQLIEFLRQAIVDPLIAGLLLGKTERARELGIHLHIEEGCHLDILPVEINAEDLVTILGNLIDNAFDSVLAAKESKQCSEPAVMVSISDYGTEVILEVEDNGLGLPDKYRPEELFEKGISSKAKTNRGVGLYLVNTITKTYHGQFDIINGLQGGARVTIYLPKDQHFYRNGINSGEIK